RRGAGGRGPAPGRGDQRGGPGGRVGRAVAAGGQPQPDHRPGGRGGGRPRRRQHRPGQCGGQPRRHQRRGGTRQVRTRRRAGGPDRRAGRPGDRRGPGGDPEMTARPLSGKELAAQLRQETAEITERLTATGRAPALAVVTATEDESSAWYVQSIAKAAGKVGIDCRVDDLGPTATPEAIRARLAELSADPGTDGIILQTPLPAGTTLSELGAAIAPEKDVDGANPLSLGRLMVNRPAFAPATAEAVVRLLGYHEVDLAGREVVVVGRSAVVGKPPLHR